MNKIFSKSSFFLRALPLLVPAISQAAPVKTNIIDNMKNTANANGGGYDVSNNDQLFNIIGIVIKSFFSLLGVIFVVLIVYAGYNYFTAGGDEQKVEKAISIIWRAIIGLIITVGAYAIWNFVASSGLI